MKLVDLTLPIPAQEKTGRRNFSCEDLPIRGSGGNYTGVVHTFSHDGMVGTYLDLPGHIRETDDGADAASWPLKDLWRVEATVVHLDRASGSGAVGLAEILAACPKPPYGQAFVLNALGKRRFDEIAFRSVWLAREVVEWVVAQRFRLFVSDIYESPEIHGVFRILFAGGVATVCHPVDLIRLDAPRARLTILAPRYAGVVQLPCRAVAEIAGE